jgi:hypothetical protein
MGWTERTPSKSECSILPTVRHLQAGFQQHPAHIPVSRLKGRTQCRPKGVIGKGGNGHRAIDKCASQIASFVEHSPGNPDRNLDAFTYSHQWCPYNQFG